MIPRGWQAAPWTGVGVLSEVGLHINVAALLASVAPLYKIACVPCQSQASLGVLVVVARAPFLDEPDLSVSGTPDILRSPTHTPHVSTLTPLTSLLCHPLSLPAILSAAMLEILYILFNIFFVLLTIVSSSKTYI